MRTLSCVGYGHFSNFTSLSKSSISSSSSSSSLPFLKNPIPVFRSFTISSSVAASVQGSASSTIGASNEAVEAMASSGVVGANDLLILGPGVLGRFVAEQWREDTPTVPIGRSPRRDVLLKAEKVVLDFAGFVVRLAGLYMQEVMDLVEKSRRFSKKFEAFTGTSDPLGKKLNSTKTRKELRWELKYPSFAEFLGVSA